MPGVRGRAWGNALGGYRLQKRVGGRFVSGKVGGFQATVHNARKTKANRTKWNKRIAIGGGVVAVAAAAGGGYAAYRAGLFKGPSTGQPKIVVSGPAKFDSLGRRNTYGLGPVSAMKEGGRNVVKAATKGSVVEQMVGVSNNLVGSVKGAGAALQAMTESEGIDKALHASRAVAGIATAGAATAVGLNVTVGTVKSMVHPPHVPGEPRKGGRPKGSKNKPKEGAAVAAQITKGAPATAKSSNNTTPIVQSRGMTLSQADRNAERAMARETHRENARETKRILTPHPKQIRVNHKRAVKSSLITAKPKADTAGTHVTEHVPTPAKVTPPKGKTKASTAAPNVEHILNHRAADAKHVPPFGEKKPGVYYMPPHAESVEAAIARRKAHLRAKGE
jgi:hypothetical protein